MAENDENTNEELQDINQLKEEIEKHENESIIESGADSCPLCNHPYSKQLTEVFYSNNQSIFSAKKWFENKFRRNYADSTWEKHFQDHVVPFIESYHVVRQRKLDDLMERSANIKKNKHTTEVTMLKQMLFEMIVDGFVAKPEELNTKENMVKWKEFANTICKLQKAYQDYIKIELEMLNFGKSREEQEEVMSNWVASLISDIKTALKGIPEAEKRIDELFDNPEGFDVPSSDTE